MTPSMKSAISVLVGFLHDFVAGIWAACTLAIWWLERSISGATDPGDMAVVSATATLAALERQFFYIALGCVAIVLAAGAGRIFTYVDGVYGPDAEVQRRRMLMAKHAVLLIVFGAGTMWQYMAVFG